ncbi:hypothetical protein SCHPADRAFT_130289 [Schizopora paradoxa]|uniref:Uncharacterized protein n=1 Tax=Schizopora paradoxa TaxID=27342 RepID=A0A0H2S2Q8_9AGAM|nr:hypothetical protein SCHPADRAFT_130289 [Schizopora paradoxa]
MSSSMELYFRDVQLEDPDLPFVDLRDMRSNEALYCLSMNFLELNTIWSTFIKSKSKNPIRLSTIWKKIHWVASVTHQRVQQSGDIDSKICNVWPTISAWHLASYTYQIHRAARIALEYINASGALKERSSQVTSQTQRVDWSYSAESFRLDGPATGWPRSQASRGSL